jgi:hypothetical protein
VQCALQHPLETTARHLLRSELCKMCRRELGVEQDEAAADQARAEIDQRNLRGVAGPRKHALAEERAAQGHTVEPADKPACVIPRFNGMTVSTIEQAAIQHPDFAIDPRAAALRRLVRTVRDDLIEIAVDANLERLLADGAGQTTGNMDAVERNDPAPLRVLQVELGRVRACRHRKNAVRIGAQQVLNGDVVEATHCGNLLAAAHRDQSGIGLRYQASSASFAARYFSSQ